MRNHSGFSEPRWRWFCILLAAGILSACRVEGAVPVSGSARTNGFQLLDLSRVAAPQGSEASKRFSLLQERLQFHDGVPFMLGEKVAVTGLESSQAGDIYPTEANLGVGGRFKRLHLLHSTLNFAKDGTPVAAIKIHYASGGQESLRIGYGIHVRAWMRSGMEKKTVLADVNSRQLQLGMDSGDSQGGLRYYHTVLENPSPNEAVASVEIQSFFSRATPVILAVSLEGEGSNLGPGRPQASRKGFKDLNQFPDSVYRRYVVARATAGAGGAPLTNAVAGLAISDDAHTFFIGEAQADAQGVCRIPFPPNETVGFNLLVRAPDYIPQVFSQSRSNQPDLKTEIVAALERGTKIGGVVKAEDGKAISGAEVTIHKVVKTGPREYARTDYDVVRTDTTGKWSSSSLPQDFQGFSFQVSHPEYRPIQYNMPGVADAPVGGPVTGSRNAPFYRQAPDGSMVLVTPGDIPNGPSRNGRPSPRNNAGPGRPKAAPLLSAEALRVGTAEMTLEPAIVVFGIVMDSSGKPLPKADLVFQRRTPTFERKYVKTDNDGHFRITTSDVGDAAMIVLREGQTPKYHLLNIEPKMGPLEIRLAPARVLRGRVMDRQQNPVPAAKLRLEEWMGMDGLLQFETLTDNEGRFAWTGAPPDQLTFYISKTNYFNMRHSISGSSEDMVIYLNRPNGIYGKVFDAQTRKPIEAFTIIRGRKYNSNDERIQWERYDSVHGVDGEYSVKMDPYYFQPEARIMVEAPGYVPQISRGFGNPGAYTNDFALLPGKGIEGVVQLTDGTAAAGAVVVLVEKEAYAYMDTPGTFRQGSSNGDFARTDSKGHFEFSPKLEPEFVLVSHEGGFAELRVSELAKQGKMVLQPWSTIKGVMKLGDKVGPDLFARLQNNYNAGTEAGRRGSGLSMFLKAEPDDLGNFIFEKVPPGERMLYAEYKFKENNYGETPLSHGQAITAKPGATNEAIIGGNGRKVTGFVKVIGGDQTDVDWKRDVHRLTLVQSPAGKLSPAPTGRIEGNYVMVFETNGAFRVDNVPPGHYTLNINPNDPEEEYYRNKPLGNLSKQVEVPGEPGAKVNQPFELGTLELRIQPKVKIGKRVPDFEVKSFTGKPIKLDDFKGKLLLVYFYASTSYSTYDFQVLKDLNTAYAGKLVVLGMDLDSTLQTAEQFAQRNQITWPQAFLGEWSQTQVPALFGVDGYPVGVLVDAEGKLIARQLRSSRIRDAVRNALSGGEQVEAGAGLPLDRL